MELEVSGAAHCSVERCHQLDFLPFRCDACGQVFCKDHFGHAKHNCPRADTGSVQVLLCPICKEAIRVLSHEDPNLTWERHFTTTCTQSGPKRKGPLKCPVPGCKEQMGPSNRFDCQRCGMTVCMRHRMQEDHPCRPAPAAASRRSQSQPAQRTGPRGGRGPAGSLTTEELLSRRDT